MSGGCLSVFQRKRPEIGITNFSDHDEINVTFDGEVIQKPSEEGPLRVELQFTNEGPKREFGFEPVAPGLFHDPDGKLRSVPDDREPVGLWDHDGPDIIPESPEDSCWRPQNRIVSGPYLEDRVLDTGDQLSERYTLLTAPDVETCLPSGTHRLETTFSVNGDHTLQYDVVIP